MKIRRLYEDYDKKLTKEYLDNKYNYQKHEYSVYQYPGGPGHELFSGSLDECLIRYEKYEENNGSFGYFFIVDRDVISHHIDQDELRELLDAKKYNL